MKHSNLVHQDASQAAKFSPIDGPEPHRSGASLNTPWSAYGPTVPIKKAKRS